jgi:hypothetical protein
MQILALLDRFPERHAIARFPYTILGLYRKLALYGALPTTYGLAFVLGSSAGLLLSFLETVVVTGAGLERFPLGILFLVLLRLVLPFFLAFWIYRGVYSLFGLLAVYYLGRRILPIQLEQPVYFVLDRQGIATYRGIAPREITRPASSEDLTLTTQTTQPVESGARMLWSDIRRWVKIDFKLWRQPIDLISRTEFRTGSNTLILEGSTAGYAMLVAEVEKRLQERVPPVDSHDRSFVFLEPLSSLLAVLFSFAISWYLYAIDQIEVTGGLGEEPMTSLPISTVVTFTIPTLLLVFPAVVLVRRYLHRLRYAGKDDEGATRIVPLWTLLLATIAACLAALGWILYLAFQP